MRAFRPVPLLVLLAACSPPSDDDNVVILTDNNIANNANSANSSNGGLNAVDVEPLDDTSFVFIRRGAGGDAIVAYDVASGAERVITDLGDAPAEIASVAIHPDRTSVAFASYYRITAADLGSDTAPTEAIWLTDVRGESFRRLMQPLPGPGSSRCSTDADCSPEECLPVGICATSRTVSLGGLAWSADGDRLYFELNNYEWNGGTISGGTTTGWIDLDATVPELGSPQGCSLTVSPAPGPDGRVILVHDVCVGATAGLFVHDRDLGSAMNLVDLGTVDFDFSLDRMDWTTDGTALAAGAYGTFPVAGGTLDGHVVLYADLVSGDVATLGDVLPDDTIHGVVVSPDDSMVATCRARNGEQNLWVLDARATPPVFEQVTTDGRSCSASW